MSVLVLVGLGLLLGSVVLRLWYQQQAWWVTLLMLLAVACMFIAFYTLAQHNKRSRYRRHRWHVSDTILCAASLAPTLAVVVVRLTDNLSLTYYPFPPNGFAPAFNPWLGLALALFAAAGIISALRETPAAPGTDQPSEANA
jgi:uncharacterized membrane protein YhaH (DUF805 family)